MLSVSVRKITLPKFVFVEDVNSKGEGEGGGGLSKNTTKGVPLRCQSANTDRPEYCLTQASEYLLISR